MQILSNKGAESDGVSYQPYESFLLWVSYAVTH